MLKKESYLYLMITLVSIISILSTIILWENHKQIKEIKSTFENRKFNVESLGEELEGLFKSYTQDQSSNIRTQFLKTPYCSTFKKGYLSVYLVIDDYKAHIWDVDNEDYTEYKKVKPNFQGRIVNGIGGLSIQFLEDNTTYFPENITFDEKGKIISFFIEDSKYRPCP